MHDRESVVRHLVGRGLVDGCSSVAAVTELTGGVSSDVFAITGARPALVVKRALPRLRVEQEWLADVGRVAIEARALQLAGTLAPGSVPRVLDYDRAAHVLVMARAPTDWAVWRDELLGTGLDPAVGARLGSLLAIWHGETARNLAMLGDLWNTAVFEQLRLEPFHRTVARRHPAVAGRVLALATGLLDRKACLVHGDFSPKNILVDPHGERLWVLDWEVAHVGDPAFDVAFMLTHLTLKAVHRPAHSAKYRAIAEAFLDAYRAGIAGGAPEPPRDLAAHVGCLLLARVDGKSPAGYLTTAERERVRSLGLALLTDPGRESLGWWDGAE